MLEIFRKNLFINNLLLLPYIFLLRLSALLHPVAYTLGDKSNIFQKLIFVNVTGALLQNIFADILLFVQALLINHLFLKHKFSKEITLYAGLFYIIYCTLMVENTNLSPVLIANTFIILATMSMLNSYKVPVATSDIFNAGFLMGMASLFYSAYFIYIVFGIIALLQLRSFKILEKIQFFIGIIIPYFLLFTYRYWNDITFIDLNFLKDIFFKLPSFEFDYPVISYVAVLILMVSVLFTIVNYGIIVGKKSIQSQKKIDTIFWLMVFSLISFLIFNSEKLYHLLTLAFPLSVLMSVYVSDSKKKLIHEVIHIMIISVIFISHFKLISW